MIRRLHQNKGFTLIELFVAWLILTITGLVLYYMFNQGQVLMLEQEHREKVFEAAQKRMTVYKLLSDQKHIETGTFRGTERIEVEEADPEHSAPALNITANWTTRIQATTDLYEIEITYNWEELSGREYNIFMKSGVLIKPYGG